MAIHLASMLPSRSSDLPGNSGGPPSSVPLFGLAPGGVYLAPIVTDGTGELLPHPFTLTQHSTPRGYPGGSQDYPSIGRIPHATNIPLKLSAGRSAFCGTFLPVAGTGRYPAPCPAEPGLSSPALNSWEVSTDHNVPSHIGDCPIQAIPPPNS